MAITIVSTVRPLAEASDDITALASHWHSLCGARTYPSRRDIDPADLRPYLGNICILEVVGNSVDFIYRLFGSILVDYVHQDMTGKSVLDLPPAELGQGIFEQLQETIRAGEPLHFHTEVTNSRPPGKSGITCLNMPLSDDGETIDRILTYTRFEATPREFWPHIAD